MKPIPPRKKANIISLLNSGLSARKVAEKTGVSHPTVLNVKKGGQLNPSVIVSGRPKALSDRHERYAVNLITSGQCSTAVEANNMLKAKFGAEVSTQTVRRALVRYEYSGRVKRRKPWLSKTNKKKRMSFAKMYKGWTISDWKRVIFSDESKFCLFGSDGKKYCWRKPGEEFEERNLQPTVKHGGGSVVVWGCITADGVGNLVRIEGNMDALLYQQILSDDLLATLEWYEYEADSIIFQHDNDPKHTANSTKEWLHENRITVLGWPPQSPDLNPIEHIWNEVDRRLQEYSNKPKNKDGLWERLVEVWNGIGPEFCFKLVQSVPKRVDEVFMRRGGCTKY